MADKRTGGNTAHRRLGRSDLTISQTGFGAWSVGGAGFEYRGTPERDEQSVAAMLHAFERGVSWVDTAPIYGRGHSEELTGAALRRVRGTRPVVFTKCGRLWDGPDAQPRSDLRPASIRAGCESSLRRLGVEAIDLMQFHWPDHQTGVPVEESWGELMRLMEEGKIRAAGVCNFDRRLLERCEPIGHVDSLQTPLSMIARGSAGGLIQWCAKHEIGVIVYSPMQVGLLTDSFTAAHIETYDPDDWRRVHPEFQLPSLERNLALRDSLRPIAAAHATTVAAVAVAWALEWPGVTGAIVGARTIEQVDGWIGAMHLSLAEGDLDAIAQAIATSRAGTGPTRPA